VDELLILLFLGHDFNSHLITY